MKKIYYFIGIVTLCTAFVLSNPNCPTGKTGAPSASTGSSSNCTSCHGDYTLNSGGGGIVVTGLPSTYVPGTAYSFSIKLNHGTADRKVWGYAIKAIDTVTRNVVGVWATTNANSSIKGTAGGTSYELSHANAGTTTSANTYTYNNLTWTAPAVPTVNQARVKFYISAVAGDQNGNEAGDYVYTTTFTSNQYVAPPPPVATLPATQVITQITAAGVCDTLKTFSVPVESGVSYAWSIGGAGNYIVSGQGTNSIKASTKVAGSVYVTLSNTVGSIPTISSAFTRALPPAPVGITGSISPCPSSSFTYTTSSIAPTASQVSVSRYRWTIPTGSTITSANTDSSSITISFGSAFSTGAIAVKSESSCGIFSAAKSVTLAPAKPLDLVSSTGFWNACIGNSVIYSVVGAIGNTGSMYRWTKPNNTSIISANTDSSVVTVQFNTGYTGGALTVKSSTSCGTLGAVLSKTLTHLNCAPGTRMGVEELQEDLINIYPNPNNGIFTLNLQSSDKSSDIIHISIIDVHGRIVYTDNLKSLNGVVSKKYNIILQRGLYMIYYTTKIKTNTVKFIVQ